MTDEFAHLVQGKVEATRRPGIHCVFLTCFDAEYQVFAELLRYFGIRLYAADTVEKSDFLLTVTEATVLLCDTLFLDGDCDSAVDMLAAFHPHVSLVLIADEADRARWPKAFRCRACGLARPLRMTEIRAAIRLAHSGRAAATVPGV
ncbi:MAG TPA: hypothetical protein VFA33_16540 [Bryobacteraceae bacterium]|nr:hypothetical protein [Bryobacteraceae bacterium]